MEPPKLHFLANPTLETERLVLRRLTLDDAPDVFAYASDPEVTRFLLWDTHASLEDSVKFIQWSMVRYEKDEAGEWGIILKETGRLIGCMGIVKLNSAHFCAEIGYVLSRTHWRKGYMPEALRRLVRFCFEDLGLNRVEAVHAVENGASGRVMQKAGMSYEGTLRQKAFTKGRFWDVKSYSVLKSDEMPT